MKLPLRIDKTLGDIVDADHCLVAEVWPLVGPKGDDHANRIVGAVNCHDDLLAACKARLDEWHADTGNMDHEEPTSVVLARAAIAKAES